jgi:chromosome segregation ATPase
MRIAGKVWSSFDGESINLWIKGQQDRYDFKHRISNQRLIKNLIEAYTEIASRDAHLKVRLEKLTSLLELSKEQLGKKRDERDRINQKVLTLKQEKAFLESELSIQSDL